MVDPSAPFDLGLAGEALAWAPHERDATHALWPLEAPDDTKDARLTAVESLRATRLGEGYAVAFRRANAVWVGTLQGKGDALAVDGPLARISAMGPQVGSPTLAASGETVLLAFADRASSGDPWRIRFGRTRRGQAAPEMSAFEPPPGGLGEHAMAPALAALPGGGFLFAWTEGPVSTHQVRAMTLDESGAPASPAFVVSAEGANAGQGQAAVASSGKGLVAFFVADDGGDFALVAAPITCGVAR